MPGARRTRATPDGVGSARSSCSALSSGSVIDRPPIERRRSRVPPREWSDGAADLVRDLTAIGRRMRLAELLRVTAVAVPLAAVAGVLLKRSGLPALPAGALALAFLAGVSGWWLSRVRRRCTPAAAARAVEAARPSSRNVVITARRAASAPRARGAVDHVEGPARVSRDCGSGRPRAGRAAQACGGRRDRRTGLGTGPGYRQCPVGPAALPFWRCSRRSHARGRLRPVR